VLANPIASTLLAAAPDSILFTQARVIEGEKKCHPQKLIENGD
jgi:hypothetical protein